MWGYPALFGNTTMYRRMICKSKTTGPASPKLTTSLVNVSSKFQTLISAICHYLLSKKCQKLLSFFQQKISVSEASLIFSTKNISVFGVFGYKVINT